MTGSTPDSSVGFALDSRLIGSNIFESKDPILNRLLSLHYRTHYHTSIPSKQKDNVLLTLLTELDAVTGSVTALQTALSDNIHTMIYTELGKKKEAASYLSKKLPNLSEYQGFSCMLQLERVYYRGNVSVRDVTAVMRNIPNRSNGLTWHYLNVIVKELDLSDSKPNSQMTWLLHILAGKVSDPSLLSFGQTLLKRSHFPNADETNNKELEQFHLALHHYFEKTSSPKKEWEGFLIESIGKTFQSIPVTKSCFLYYSKSDTKRCVLNFNNLVNYSNKFFELKRTYPDLVDLISSYQFILSTTYKDFEPFFKISEVSNRLLILLEQMHSSFNIPLLKKKPIIEYDSNASTLCLSSPIAFLLSNSWLTLYNIQAAELSSLLDYTQLYFLANALQTSLSPSKSLKFQFAYQLATIRQIDQCIIFLKKHVLNHHPNHFASWHLLALCESCVNEDLQISFKIINSVIQSMCDLFDDGTQFTTSEKWQFIHIKLTQIQLVREMFALEDALELLPEAFELYQQLFSEDVPPLGSDYSKSNEYLLQTIWLYALELYLESGDLENVNASLEEFKNVTSKYINLNHNLAQGFVFLKSGNEEKAMIEFEKVLHFDSTSVEALLGLAKLVLPQDELTLESELKHIPDPKPNHITPSLSSINDRSSALARLKFLFEQLVDKSIEGYHTSAVWWFLAKIYETYQDSSRQQHALWQCIKFEELDPVREFRFCKF